jgi:hypothetical protein
MLANHPLAAMLVLTGAIAVSLLVLLWIETRDDSRHEMQDHEPEGR